MNPKNLISQYYWKMMNNLETRPPHGLLGGFPTFFNEMLAKKLSALWIMEGDVCVSAAGVFLLSSRGTDCWRCSEVRSLFVPDGVRTDCGYTTHTHTHTHTHRASGWKVIGPVGVCVCVFQIMWELGLRLRPFDEETDCPHLWKVINI